MKKKNKFFRTIIQILILMLVASYFTSNFIEYTYATNLDNSPNVIVNINENGSMTQEGNLFHGSLFPSSMVDAENGIGSIKGVIRLVNNYEKVNIDNISIGLDLSQMEIRNDYPENIVYNSFLDNLRLKIEKGRVFNFDKILVDYTNLRNLIFDSNNSDYNGYNLVNENRFSLNKGDSIDLKYTLHMVEEAGNELQSVTAIMPIYINLHGDHAIDHGDDNDDVIIPPMDIPVIDAEEIVFEGPIPGAQPEIESELIVETKPEGEVEEPVVENPEFIEDIAENDIEEPTWDEEFEIDEEIPQARPGTSFPKTGSVSPLINIGIGTIILGLGFFLKKKD